MVNKKFEQYLRELDPGRLSKREQALRYLCLGDEEKARQAFAEAANEHVYRSRFDIPGFRDELRSDRGVMNGISESQIEEAIYLFLAGADPGLVRDHLAWAAENADLPADEVEKLLKYSADEVAIARLWRGYALLLLGQKEEACRLLGEVVPLFNLAKLTREEVYHTMQYSLPKALVPLCEYELHPSEKNRQSAADGVEAFVNSFKYNAEKLIAYLYYFHLKKSFPDAYEGSAVPAWGSTTGIRDSAAVLKRPAGGKNTTGGIVVFEKGTGSLEILGSQGEFEQYLEKVKRIGDYPAIAMLMETFVLDKEQEPAPLIDDCRRLLAAQGMEPDVRAITGSIMEVAEAAGASKAGVILYYDPEV